MPMNAIVHIYRMESTTTDGVAPPYEQQYTLHSLHCTLLTILTLLMLLYGFLGFGTEKVSDVDSGYPLDC